MAIDLPLFFSFSIRGSAPVLGLCALACGANPTIAASGLEVTLASSVGAPSPYRVVLSDAAHVSAQTCPEQTDPGPVRCTAEGVQFSGGFRPEVVTVKAPGFGWRTLTLDETLGGSVEIELDPLSPFEQGDDYATGLERETGETVFREMAVPVDTELGPSHSVKFLITDLDTEPQVYLQNTRRHPLHYDFARGVLGRSSSLSEFEAATYHGDERDTMAGTLTLYPELSFESRAAAGEIEHPILLGFFPSDDLDPEQMIVAHTLLEERLHWVNLEGPEHRLVYLPAGERQRAELESATFDCDRRGIVYTDPEEIYAGLDQQTLNPGVAYGTLGLFTPEQLETQVVSWLDIVVLTRLPNELPVVAGTITAELQTPLAHVNLAARARGTPNLALRDADTDPRITEHLGKLVRFEVARSGFSLEPATLAEAEEYWGSRRREAPTLASDVEDRGLPGFEDVVFADSIFCGVKAANLGELRQTLGDQAPIGFVVPFFGYQQHMSSGAVTADLCTGAHGDCLEEKRSAALCAASHERCSAAAAAGEVLYDYAARLIADAELQTDAPLREACLDGLVDLVRHAPVDPEFAARLDARVTEVFGSSKARLRSSTNAEDLPDFSGAGLYDSVSADPADGESASLEIRKVWASTWAFKAFEERAYWGIDHLSVKMGVAVNPARDDEAANGVLITQNITNPGVAGMYVNVQLGETSVTNPENGVLPEVFSILPDPAGGVQVARQRFSSLSPNHSLLSESEVDQLYLAAARVAQHFAPLYETDISELALDLEFKFCGPERALLIKQARPYAARTVSAQP